MACTTSGIEREFVVSFQSKYRCLSTRDYSLPLFDFWISQMPLNDYDQMTVVLKAEDKNVDSARNAIGKGRRWSKT